MIVTAKKAEARGKRVKIGEAAITLLVAGLVGLLGGLGAVVFRGNEQ